MSEISQGTDPQNDPGATGTPQGDPATNPKGGGAATGDGDTITLSKEDHKKLVSQRDAANEQLRGMEDYEDMLDDVAKDRFIDGFFKDPENVKAFPDVKPEDLRQLLSDPDKAKETAQYLQDRITDAAHKKVSELEVVDTPRLTQEEKTEKLNKLRNSGDPQAFEKMVGIRTAPRK